MRIRLTPRKTINNIRIVERQRKGDTSYPKYLAIAPDGRHLEEFRRFPSAAKWARETEDFIGQPTYWDE
jgi:hypothetical protein